MRFCSSFRHAPRVNPFGGRFSGGRILHATAHECQYPTSYFRPRKEELRQMTPAPMRRLIQATTRSPGSESDRRYAAHSRRSDISTVFLSAELFPQVSLPIDEDHGRGALHGERVIVFGGPAPTDTHRERDPVKECGRLSSALRAWCSNTVCIPIFVGAECLPHAHRLRQGSCGKASGRPISTILPRNASSVMGLSASFRVSSPLSSCFCGDLPD